MSAATRQMHLGVFVLGAGNHSAGWRWEGAAVSNNDLAVIQEIARIAERGKFDLLFVSDGLDYEQGDLPSFMCRFEPTSLISVLSAHTTRLGLGATVSTSFTEPYNVARLFASIDHISQGRAAWNVVTSSRPKAALNFNLDRQMDHELRYQRAEEFVDVVKIRPLDHKGRFFPCATSTTLPPRRAVTGSSAAPRLGLPTRLKSGSSRAPPTATTYCRPISLTHSPILSTWSCRNYSTAASSVGTTKARHCAPISACPGWRRQRGYARPPGPNNDDRSFDATACEVLAIDEAKERTVAPAIASITRLPAPLAVVERVGFAGDHHGRRKPYSR